MKYIYTGAIFSPDRVYRYVLQRKWSEGGRRISFVCLNPSKADENIDDPTVRRVVDFARHWGYDELNMLNIFGLRSTDPKELVRHYKVWPAVDENEKYLRAIETPVVCAWGTWGALYGRGEVVKAMFKEPLCLGFTKDGYPRHPLYVKATTEAIKF